MKKKILIIIGTLVFLFLLYFVGTGFIPVTSVFLEEYTISEDQSQLQMKVGVASSIGFIGRYTTKKKDNDLYITFYSAFGGINSSLGAGNSLTIDLPPQCDAIYFNGSEPPYRLTLKKNSVTGEWERVPLS